MKLFFVNLSPASKKLCQFKITVTDFAPPSLTRGNWNATSFNGKEQESVWEAAQYHFNIIKVSSTKRRGSDTVKLNGNVIYC